MNLSGFTEPVGSLRNVKLENIWPNPVSSKCGLCISQIWNFGHALHKSDMEFFAVDLFQIEEGYVEFIKLKVWKPISGKVFTKKRTIVTSFI